MTMWLEYLKIYDKINLRKDKISKEKMVMRKIRRKRNKQRKIIVISLTCFLFIMVGGYAAFQTNLNITAKGNIAQKSRVIQSWTNTDNTDFHSDYYKENIVSATFLDNNDIPSNAVESWNVSEDKNHGGVMAWVVQNSEDNTKYDLYIGVDGGVIANEDSGWLFFAFLNLANIEFNNNFDTSNATTMVYMFDHCVSLTTLDISSFDTRNVTNMAYMFNMFDNSTQTVTSNRLSNIIFGNNWDTKNVSSMAQLFAGCNNLEFIDVSNWNTLNVVDMSSIFAYCQNLIELDLSKWNTSSATNMAWMFMRCDSLQNLNISNFNTSKVTTMRNMFTGDRSLQVLNLCSFDTSNVASMHYMFNSTINLQQIKVGSGWTMANVTDATQMFTNSGVSGVTTGQC